MNHSFLLFASSFVAVLLFGFQSQIVRDKHQKMAFFTSLCIGLSQLVFFKYVPNASFWEAVFWILGGACGIVTSIHAHNFWLKYFPSKKYHNIGPKPTIDNTVRIFSDNTGKVIKTFERGHPAYIASIDD